MKVFIVSALLIGLAATQSVMSYNAATAYCSTTNETTACANLTDACCGTVTTKVGSATATTLTRCISRHLTELVSSTWYGTTASNTTVSYACLNSTKPSTYTTYPSCVNDTSCSSGYCCSNANYTIMSRSNVNISSTVCVPGSMGTNPGTNTSFTFNTGGSLGDLGLQTTCYAALNTHFYSSAAVLKSAIALAMVALLSLAF